MKHLLSILIFFSFMSVASAKINGLFFSDFYDSDNYYTLCNELGGINTLTGGCYLKPNTMCMDAFNKPELCHTLAEKYDAYVFGSKTLINLSEIRYQAFLKEELSLAIPFLILVVIILAYIIRFFIRRTKNIYQKSSIPLKNKVKRKELETRLNELDEVKPAEHTYKKTAYVDDTEEINEVKKLERQIKIKKLQKELKDLEEE